MLLRKGRSGTGPTRRSVRVAIVLFAALIAFVVVANLLWTELPPSETTQPRMSPSADPFPVFRMGPTLHAVALPTNANLSTRLLMTSLPVLFDYASRNDWTSLTPIAAYDRAMRDLYPSSTTMLLAILPPDRWAIRDYLVATRTFVFYFPQGILATPFEAAATRRILQATPRGIPILGWFNSPTLTEENSFVQLASGEGKFVVGAQDVPNLTVLTALGRNESRRQAASSPASLPLENKTYAVLAVPDGDNIDFAAGRMQELWSEPTRGTIP